MPLAAAIADALRRGATILTASPRAARSLELQYAEDQRAAGHSVWPSPPIRDWDNWLRDLYAEHAFAHPDAPMLLSALQERSLWTTVQHDDAGRVVSPESMAALAMEAWERLSQFNAHPARRSAWGLSPTFSDALTDAERFRTWAAEFERLCIRNNWISFSQLAPLLAAAADLTLPPALCLVGFDRTTPAQHDFLSALAERGVAIDTLALPPLESQRVWRSANDAREEITACAVGALDVLLENPSARIAVIVPGLADRRGLLDRIFRRILMPASEDIRHPSALLPWEFSLGLPLADNPAIRAALLLLRWIANPLPAEEVSWLLLSGFVSDTATNSLAVAHHDALDRRAELLRPQRSLGDFASSLPVRSDFEILRTDLTALLQAVTANRILTQPRLASAWADLIPLLLDRAAWPGRRAPDSVQFQALQRWQRLLDDLALLDFDGQPYTFSDFLALLEAHAAETIFAPESHDAPIQILGPFEASGQQFDALWFLGADDSAWPQRGRLHPLLPPAIQRQYAMPHATPEDDWNLAHAVTARLLLSAPRIVFSYARQQNDVQFRPSPLIAGLFSSPAEAVAAVSPEASPATLDPIPDDPTAPPWPRERHAGGADVLRRQSACPFQAFAAKRLAAQPLDSVEWGLDPIEKGDLVHKILQHFFTGVRTHQQLVTVIDTNQLGERLDRSIDSILSAWTSTDAWEQSYLAAEHRRLQARLAEWLTTEAQRHPFTVESLEHKLTGVQVGDLRLDLRADRIDLLADGSRLIIDYKTGDVSPASWRNDRPDEPQLPLYAAYGNVENLSGVVFAKIRAGKTGFDGRMRDAQGQLCPDVSTLSRLVTEPYSEAMREDWARVLRALADRFLQGYAAVDPRDAAVCRHCDFPALCRKAELDLAGRGDNEDANA